MRFEYLEAASVKEAVSLIAKYNGRAKVIAGGTDLIVQVRRGMIKPEYVINIGKINGLDFINYDKEGLKIGALTTVRSLEKSEKLKKNHLVISEAAGQLASIGVRNIATVGGNLCNASPSADMAPSLIGLGAEVKIAGPKRTRKVLLEDFFKGPGITVLGNGEMLVEIQVPKIPPKTGAAYLKYGIRGSIDLAIVGVAAVITLGKRGECQEAKIVLGAVAPTPMRARKAEEILKGKKIDQELIQKSGEIASEETRPISDVRATAEYRKEMVKVFTGSALKEALARTGVTEK